MNYNTVKYNEHFSNKNTIMVMLIIIIAVAIPTFEYHSIFNFWLNLNSILVGSYTNMLLMIACMLNTSYYINKNAYKYLTLSRCKTYGDYLKNNLKDIFVINLYVFISFLIVSIASAIMFSYNNFSLPIYESYSIDYRLYLLIFLVREFFIVNIVMYIYYLFLEKNNDILNILLIILFAGVFMIEKIDIIQIGNLYITYTAYFKNGIYQSLLQEIINSGIYILFIYIIFKILFSIFARKKRDVI